MAPLLPTPLQIDWHDFVIVETIDFYEDEDEELPPPMSLKELLAFNKQQALQGGGAAAAAAVVEAAAMEEDEDAEQVQCCQGFSCRSCLVKLCIRFEWRLFAAAAAYVSVTAVGNKCYVTPVMQDMLCNICYFCLQANGGVAAMDDEERALLAQAAGAADGAAAAAADGAPPPLPPPTTGVDAAPELPDEVREGFMSKVLGFRG
jgi:hypothetical protein